MTNTDTFHFDEDNYIKLYTCESGASLGRKGLSFSAWDMRDHSDDVMFYVNKSHVGENFKVSSDAEIFFINMEDNE